MAELFLVRHAQASFGAANYDKLSELGHEQSRELGRALKAQGIRPSAVFIGDMVRHRETLDGILQGLEMEVEPGIHTGLNEFDFTDLLNAKYAGQPGPENMHTERKSHFRTLRDTVLEWEQGGIPGAAESWADFTARVEAARKVVMDPDHAQVLAVSSGGPIARLIAAQLDCGPGQQIKLQLQIKNCAVNRFVYSAKSVYLHGFNETPHINAANQERLLTYS
ncbi:histidine phosphatase family protein [Aquicoccus porphyridii]|uniref:Histidine phosphatase family protein n=1 Tax=Aquicoccus porphyridii TaxID=1852029 RepID=A0A5A9Z788_9RHOB|nr:histidine phosphatase family protein [Aquicoccus porphyridii]KAA0913021.1 histidine phosphatase family protein [Aquicoccus porphyridii]RAI54497.1 histidine phosphatase family protein [Rhodobacteraceae bacterium AsT-22]